MFDVAPSSFLGQLKVDERSFRALKWSVDFSTDAAVARRGRAAYLVAKEVPVADSWSESDSFLIGQNQIAI